jgi:hypothetical protein
MTYKVSENYIVRSILDECVIVPVGHLVDDCGGFIALNDSGKFVFELLASGTDSSLVPEKLCAEYETEQEQAKQDVDKFISEFMSLGVLEEA